MTVEEILDILDHLGEDEREEVLSPLLKRFSRVSLVALKEMQDRCKLNKTPYNEFVEMQNHLIRQCIEVEIGALGKMFQGDGEQLTLKTDIR